MRESRGRGWVGRASALAVAAALGMPFAWSCEPGRHEARGALAKREVDFTESEFLGAVRRNDTLLARQFLQAGMNPDAMSDLETALVAAAGRGHVEMARMLIRYGADVHRYGTRSSPGPGSSHETAVIAAAGEGSLEIVEILLAEGADPARIDRLGGTALTRAAWGGHERVVERLLEVVDAGPDELGQALFNAARGQSPPVVRRLLAAGAEVESRGGIGRTALIAAAAEGGDEIVGLLLEHGANVHAADDKGNTALHLAAVEGHARVVERLLAAGADVSRKNLRGESALEMAKQARSRDVLEILEGSRR